MRRIARQGWRQLFVLLVLLLTLLFLIRNLFTLQVLRASDVSMLQHYREEVASPQIQQPQRGTITDANGMPLVSTVTVFKLGAYPALIQDKPRAAHAITDIIFPLQMPQGAQVHDAKAIAAAIQVHQQHYRDILAQFAKSYTYVCLAGDDSPNCTRQDDVTERERDRIVALKLPGFDLEPRSTPGYPNGSLAAQMLGFVRYKYPLGQAVDTGQYGLEEYYNTLLSGVPGRAALRQDTSGNTIRVGPGSDLAAQQGAQLRLYLDSYIQYYVEQRLAQAVKQFSAKGGTAIVERPSDGAILAMASVPSYDPRLWHQLLKQNTNQGYSLFLNPAVNKEYEPGSTFKPIMASIGFDSGILGENTSVPDSGKQALDGITITDWCKDACWFSGTSMNVDLMLHYSSNIAAALLSHLIPATVFYQYLAQFGFGQPTGVDLPAEVTGGFVGLDSTNPVWSPADKDTIAYGQGIAVTPLQLINAYAALANGGRLLVPHVVQSYMLGGKTVDTQPQVRRSVISQDAASLITRIMVHSAVGGEACRALVPGYDIAAKTGTSTIYNSDATIASTAAFGPVDAPLDQQFVVLMKLDEPSNPFGSETAAPAVHDILQKLFNYYHIAPTPDSVTQPLKRCSGPLSNTFANN